MEGKDVGFPGNLPQLRMVAALADYLRVLIHLNYQFLGALFLSYNRMRSSTSLCACRALCLQRVGD